MRLVRHIAAMRGDRDAAAARRGLVIVSSRLSSWRSHAATTHPGREWTTNSRPIPLPPPVTTARRPAISMRAPPGTRDRVTTMGAAASERNPSGTQEQRWASSWAREVRSLGSGGLGGRGLGGRSVGDGRCRGRSVGGGGRSRRGLGRRRRRGGGSDSGCGHRRPRSPLVLRDSRAPGRVPRPWRTRRGACPSR